MTKFIDENKLVEHREQLHNADKKKNENKSIKIIIRNQPSKQPNKTRWQARHEGKPGKKECTVRGHVNYKSTEDIITWKTPRRA